MTAATGPLLEVVSLTKQFGGVGAVNRVDMKIVEGEIMGLIGPNGAGKSTLFAVITGFLRPTAGEVIYRGSRITSRSPSQRAQLGIVCMFQKTALFLGVSVLDAIRIGRHRRNGSGVLDAICRTGRHVAEEAATRSQAEQIIEFLGLREVRHFRAGTLSYGQQRLVALGTALAAEPELLLLDEPAAGLNPSESDALVEILHSVRRRGTTILLVEHDMSVTMRLSDRITVLVGGNKIAEGTPAAIRRDPAVIKAYLGAAPDAGT